METVFSDKKYCSGCGACSKSCGVHAIEMKPDEEGFLYPHINQDLCVDCGKCKRVCPFVKKNENEYSAEVYAGKNISDDVRLKSASGGIFTLLSDYVLRENGVIYGAVFDKDMTVMHIRANSDDDRDKMRGSKYVQSKLDDIFLLVQKDVKEGVLTLFTGTPCQISGLKAYLGKEYDNLILCDIICHGVTSDKVFKDYLLYIEEKYKSPVKEMCFRDKDRGWSNQKWKAVLENGSLVTDTIHINVYKNLYYAHVMQRPSCHECPYASTVRQGDITIGDFWGIENVMPEFKDELGVNLIFVSSKKGKKTFEEIKKKMKYVKLDVEKCLQPQLQYPTKKSEKREQFWKDYENGFRAIANTYGRAGVLRRVKDKCYRIIKR